MPDDLTLKERQAKLDARMHRVDRAEARAADMLTELERVEECLGEWLGYAEGLSSTYLETSISTRLRSVRAVLAQARGESNGGINEDDGRADR